MFSLLSWIQKAHIIIARSNVYKHVQIKQKLEIHRGRTCLRKSGPSLSGSSKHFSSSPRKKLNKTKTREGEVSYCTGESEQGKLCILQMCASHTLCASRRSDGCCQTRFCLFPSYHQAHPPLSSGSCNPYDETH